MTEPYLIAHLVRGEPAFDIAIRSRCSICYRYDDEGRVRSNPICDWETPDENCVGCNGEGYRWIMPTNGHKVYPYWHSKLDDCLVECAGEYESIIYGVPVPPPNQRDYEQYYESIRRDIVPDLRSLGLTRPQPKIARRI